MASKAPELFGWTCPHCKDWLQSYLVDSETTAHCDPSAGGVPLWMRDALNKELEHEFAQINAARVAAGLPSLE